MVALLHSLEFITVAFALGMAWVTGNYLRIRWYLAAMLAYKAATQGYLLFGNRADAAYYAIYSVGTLGFLCAAAWVAMEAGEQVPERIRLRHFIAAALTAVFLVLTTLHSYPELVIVVMQMAVYLLVGATTWAGSEVRRVSFTMQGSMPYAVLSRFWLVMVFLCLVYVTGMVYQPKFWYSVAEWLFAVPVIVAMPMLGWSFHTSAGVPVHVKAKGGPA